MNERMNEIKLENNKKKRIFSIILIFAVIFGMIIGFLGAKNFSTIYEGFEVFGEFAEYQLPKISAILMVIICVIARMIVWLVYFNTKKKIDEINEEEDELFETLLKRISSSLWLSMISFIIGCGLFAIVAGEIFFGVTEYSIIFASIACFLSNILFVMIEQQKLVDLQKMILPEKNISVYDVKFTKKWFDHCDEAEKMEIYQHSWNSYSKMLKEYPVAWMITFLANMYLHTGAYACILVMILWALHVTLYCLTSKKK